MKLLNSKKIIFSPLIYFMVSGVTWATPNPSDVCEAVKQSKNPTIFLIDKNGKLSNGPINFGRFPYKYTHSDTYVIPTEYKIIITPAKLKIEKCTIGCLETRKIKPLCPMSDTYTVGIVMRDGKNLQGTSSLPWKTESEIGLSGVMDTKTNDWVDLDYKFNSKITGEIYDPTTKQ